MKTYIHLDRANEQSLPPAFQHDDVRFPESLVEFFLAEYTRAGDTVFDPFAGYGTTLLVAERMGRIPFGVEFDRERVDFVRSKLATPGNLVQGDSRSLAGLELPPIDFSITSPPYMTRENHPEYPLAGYKVTGEGYQSYLQDIRNIYGQLRKFMEPAGRVILEVSNLKPGRDVTPLAWDIGREVSQVLHFEGEIIICWDQYGFGYDHSYCLVYSLR